MNVKNIAPHPVQTPFRPKSNSGIDKKSHVKRATKTTANNDREPDERS